MSMTQSERNASVHDYLIRLGFDGEKVKVITTQAKENAIYVYLENEHRMKKKLSAFLRDLGYVIHLESNSKFGRSKQ